MDAFNDPVVVEVVVMTSSQVGKTEILNNVVGYFIDQDPSPMIVVQPTLDMAQAWSKDRLSPMIRDSKRLNDIIEGKKRNVENTILHKRFPGGHITVAGSNSPASLASRPVRIALLDEVDRYDFSAGREGDATKLAEKRTTTFHNKKIGKFSTPTEKGASKINDAYEESDKRKYFVPCPHCGEMQELEWEQLEWESKEKLHEIVYICAYSGCIIYEKDKMQMLILGEWRATAPFNGKAGFYINELYSPWVTWEQMAKEFISSCKYPDQLKVFVNTALAQLWDEDRAGEGIESTEVSNRTEDYAAEVPDGVYLLTCAVDVQDDRLEIEVLGWGLEAENWSICHTVLHGSPGKPEVWKELDDILESEYQHELGVRLKIAITCIDSGGHYTEEVYQYCKKKEKQKKRVYAVKGSSQRNQPIVLRFSKNNDYRVKVFLLGTDTAKETIYARLGVLTPGAPGYMHHPSHYDDEYFEQLTAERKVKTYEKGRAVIKWTKPKSKRNEALDLKVYNFAAFNILKPNMEKIKERFLAKIKFLADHPANEKTVENNKERVPQKQIKRSPRRKGFVNSY